MSAEVADKMDKDAEASVLDHGPMHEIFDTGLRQGARKHPCDPVAGVGVSGPPDHRRGLRRINLRLAASPRRILRVLIVDSQPIARLGLKSLLATVGGIQVVGEAGNGTDAIRLARALRPNIVILDLTAEAGAGTINALAAMRRLPAPPRLLVHAGSGTSDDLAEAVVKGADGYVPRGLEGDEFAEVVRRVGHGEHVWMRMSGKPEADRAPAVVSRGALLTPSETEVYVLVSQRYSNEEIAGLLSKSLYTVKNQVRSIFRKMEVSCRKELFWS